MRQGHQNRRGRGRNNNNNNPNPNRGKGQNPLTRSFESNGPDVKIRGTPSHIAEKYISLARDAKASGDEVLAENYLQHAEHYNRIIMAFREQQISQGGDVSGGMAQRYRVPQLQDNLDDDEFGDEGDDFGGDQQSQVMRQNEPQPVVPQSQPFEGGDNRPERGEPRDYQPRSDRPDRHEQRHQGGGGHRYDDRQQRRHPDQFRHRDRDRDRDRDREPRHAEYGRQPGGDRPHDRAPMDRSADRQYDRPIERPADRPADRPVERAPERPIDQQGFVPERIAQPIQPVQPSSPTIVEAGTESVNGQRPPRAERAERGEGGPPRRRERFQGPPPAHEQPEFLRRPVRRPRREAAPIESGDGGESNAASPATPAVRDDGGSPD